MGGSTFTTVLLRADSVLTRRRVRDYAAIALLAMLAIAAGLFVAGRPPLDALGRPLGCDFAAHLTAGAMVRAGDGGRLYDPAAQAAVQHALVGTGHDGFYAPFLSPPFVAWWYAPFARWPYVAAAALWMVCTALLLVGSVALLWPLVPRLHPYGPGIVLLVLFSSQPALQLLLDGQDSGLSLLLLALGLRLLVAERDALAGGVLALGTFKPQLFLLVPALLGLERRWYGLAAWTVVAAALAALSVALVGTAGMQQWTALLGSDLYRARIAEAQAWKMQSLLAFLRTALPPLRGTLNRAPIATAGAAFVGGAVALAYLRRPAAGSRSAAIVASFAAMVLVTALVNPHMFLYDCVVLAIPILLVLDRDPTDARARVAVAALYVLTWTTPIRYYVFAAAPWPLSVVAAAWTVVPVALLLALAVRTGRREAAW